MSERITNELRKYGYGFCGDTHDVMTAIADRIDKAHEEECREEYNRGYNDGLDNSIDESFASVDDWLTNNEDEMAEHGWVRMPRDADDVPIRIGAAPVDANKVPICIGDVMEWPDGSTAEVVGIGTDTFFYVEDGKDTAEWSRASDKIHHHKPTVDELLDQLEGLRGNWADYEDVVTRASEIAEKLRELLKEDA